MRNIRSTPWLLSIFILISILSFGCTSTVTSDTEPPVIEPEVTTETDRVDLVRVEED